MSGIPYGLGDDIAGALGIPTRAFKQLMECFFGCGVFDLYMGWWGDPETQKPSSRPYSAQAVAAVVRHLAWRSYQFNKPVEFVTVKDIVVGKPSIAAPGSGLSERTIRAVLADLSPPKSDYLIKLEFARHIAVTPLRGLNLPGWLSLIHVWWDAVLAETTVNRADKRPALWEKRPLKDHKNLEPQSGLARRGWEKLTRLRYFFEKFYESTFEWLTKYGQSGERISDPKKFLSALKERSPILKPADLGVLDYTTRVLYDEDGEVTVVREEDL